MRLDGRSAAIWKRKTLTRWSRSSSRPVMFVPESYIKRRSSNAASDFVTAGVGGATEFSAANIERVSVNIYASRDRIAANSLHAWQVLPISFVSCGHLLCRLQVPGTSPRGQRFWCHFPRFIGHPFASWLAFSSSPRNDPEHDERARIAADRVSFATNDA